MEKDVRLYLAPLFSFSPSFFQLLQFGNLESSDVLYSICIKRFRNKSFTSNFYFSRISGETVNSIARDTRIEYYKPFLVVGEYILKLY